MDSDDEEDQFELTPRTDPGCEITTAEDLSAAGYHINESLYLEELSPPNGKKPLTWPLRTGLVGSNGGKCDFVAANYEGLNGVHAEIKWRGLDDEYVVFDQNSTTGTFFVMSAGKSSRQSVRLQCGDIIYLGKFSCSEASKTDSFSPEDCIQLRVNQLVPEPAPSSPHRVSAFRRQSSKRNSKAVNNISVEGDLSVEQQKLDDINVSAIKEGFKEARRDFKRNSDQGALAKPMQSRGKLGDSEKKRPTLTFTSCIDDAGRKLAIKKNRLGGSRVFEEESSLDAILCDESLTRTALSAIGARAIKEGVEIKDADPSLMEPNLGRANTMMRRFPAEECTIELEILKGTQKMDGETFKFGLEDITIGSCDSNQIQLEELSAFHMRIERDSENNYWLHNIACSDSLGTMLKIHGSRCISLLPDDILRFGPDLEMRVATVASAPRRFTEEWYGLALRVVKSRKSFRYRQLTNPTGLMFDPAFFKVVTRDEVTIGRKVNECDIALQDYEMPAFAIGINHYDRKYFINSFPESKKKGVYIELGSRVPSSSSFAKRPKYSKKRKHELNVGDTFKVGRTQVSVMLKKTESEKELQSRLQKVVASLEKVALFEGIQTTDLQALAQNTCTLHFKQGQQLIHQGEKVMGLFIILKGEVEIFRPSEPKKVLTTVKENTVLGEMSFFNGFTATASVRTTCAAECVFIDYETARSVIQPRQFEMMRLLMEQRLVQLHCNDLQKLEALSGLHEARYKVLASRMHRVILDRGAVLFERGTAQDCMYIVSSGIVFLSKEIDRNSSELPSNPQAYAQVSGGGHISAEVLTHPPPFITQVKATAEGQVVLFGLKRSVFEEVMSLDICVARELAERNQEGVSLLTTAATCESGSMKLTNMYSMGKGTISLSSGASKRSSSSFSTRSTKIIPDDASPMGQLRSSRRFRGSSVNISVNEGAEGDSFSSDLSSTNAKPLPQFDTGAAYETDDENSVASETSSVASDDVDDPEANFTLDLNFTFFQAPTQMESDMLGLSAQDLEKQLKDLPYYIVLKCNSGPQKRQYFIVTNPVTIFGRWIERTPHSSSENPFPGRRFLTFNDRTVSRVNSVILYQGGRFFISDLDSKYGTHLKLNVGVDKKLDVGDVFTCSQHEFVVYGRTGIVQNFSSKLCCSLV